MKKIASIALIILCLVAVQTAAAQHQNGQATVTTSATKTYTESEKISHLIETIRGMQGATFIRNGDEHTCKEAAEHLSAKWEKHGSKISSAEDFIKHLATKSSMSGEVYKIRFADGSEKPTADVLHQALKQLK